MDSKADKGPTNERPYLPMRKILLTTTVLGALAVVPVPVAIAQTKPSYCIPVSSAQQSAEGAEANTVSALGALTPAGLASAGGVTPMVNAFASGKVEVKITAKVRHGKHQSTQLIAQGSEKVGGAQCPTLRVKLTGDGKKLLKHSKTIQLNVLATFTASKGHKARGVATGKVTLS